MESQEKGDDDTSLMLQLERKIQIWKSLQLIQSYDQIYFFNHRDQNPRIDILKKYLGKIGNVKNKHYQSVMSSPFLEKSFADYIEMSVDTWNFIYSKYFQEIPNTRTIISYEQESENIEIKIKEYNLEIEKLRVHLENLKQNEINIKQIILKLESYQIQNTDNADEWLKMKLKN